MKIYTLTQAVFAQTAFFLIIGTLLLTGCLGTYKADYSGLGLIPVTGIITLDGKPLPNAVVFFVQENETKSYATTEANGFYRMMFNSEVEGVLPGTVTVEISTTASTGELNIAKGDAEVDPDAPKKSKKELVPAAYNKKSKLNVTVSPESNKFDFDLKLDGSTLQPK